MDHFPLDLNYTMKKKYKTTTLKKKGIEGLNNDTI